METLFAIGMMVGLVKAQAAPPKVVVPVEQRQLAQRRAEIEKPQPRKKAESEWPLSF